jgi:hypothetical protein
MIILQPPCHLSNFIDYFWYAAGQSAGVHPGRVKLIPDGKHGMIFQQWNGHPALSEENAVRYRLFAGLCRPVAFHP